MAALYLNAGRLAWSLDDADEAGFPIPAGATHVLRFDEEMPGNRAVLRAVQRETGRYALTGPSGSPVLRRDGSPVAGFPVVSPARSRHRDMRELVAIRAKVMVDPPVPLTPGERAALDRMVLRMIATVRQLAD